MRNRTFKGALAVTATVVFAGTGLLLLARQNGEGMAKAGLRLDHRLVYVSRSLQNDGQLRDISDIARRAARDGLSGLVLASAFDRIALQSPAYLERLGRVRAICDSNGLDLVASVFSVGHGNALLDNNRQLAAAVPVRDLPLTATDGRLSVAAAPTRVANGDFEAARANVFDGFALQDAPGRVTSRDTSEHRGGDSSVLIDNFAESPHGLGRIMQEVPVVPFRSYRVSCWVKTKALEPASGFQLQVRSLDNRVLMSWVPNVESTSDWRKVVTGFNSLEYKTVRIYAGVWGGRSGRAWIDDLDLEVTGAVNVLRRAGTPLTLSSERTGRIYDEGRDFVLVGPDAPTYRFDGGDLVIELPDGSRIEDGEPVRLSYYQAIALANDQMAVCMSEPEVADLWREEARLVEEYLSPEAYFIGCDEIRQGGWCVACERRGLTAGQLLGETIRLQVGLIHDANPEAGVFVWSDMFDPNHNAHGDYYLFKGSFAGSWQSLPDDCIVVCWNADTRAATLAHFDRLRLGTMAAVYFDTGSDDNTIAWLAAMQKSSGSCGVMYTTWRSDYGFLDSFATLLKGAGGDL